MASTWRCLVSDGHRLGRQWLQGRLSEETASSLRQLVADCGAASSSRATKADCLGILLRERCEGCIRTWLSTCEILLNTRWKANQTGSSFHVLFHCMGGVNRSPAAACAWLLLLHDVDVKDVISWVFEERKHLRPWRKRDYVLWALILWRKHRAELWEYFNSRWVSC